MKRIWIPSAIALIIFALLLTSAVLGPTRPSPQAKTRALIKSIYFKLGATEEDRAASLSFIRTQEAQGVAVAQSIAELVFKTGMHAIGTNMATRTGATTTVDSWGEPLLVSWRSNLPAAAAARLTKEDHDLIIWSKGPNRKNEWGHADDVSLEK